MPPDPARFFHRRLRAALNRWRGDLEGGLVVAVSGGGDSVAMLRGLRAAEPDLALTVAHFDHNARPDSAADARFVADLAAALVLPFELGGWTPERSAHFEADARKARYAWLEQVARRVGAGAVAVAHTRDDQAETILHRIVRGTGLRGLAGMPARRRLSEDVWLIRPALACGRDVLRAYLDAIGQPAREDPTNADTTRTRARIRHELLPTLADAYNPRVVEALARLGRLAGDAQRRLEGDLDRWVGRAVVESGPAAIILRAGVLKRLPPPERVEVIRLAWRRAGWPEGRMTARRWRRLAWLAARAEGGRLHTVGGIDVALAGDLLRMGPARVASNPERQPAPLPVPGSAAWGVGRITASLDPGAPGDERIDLDALDLDRSGAGLPTLWVRAPGVGDRFAPLGMGGKSMALNDFLRGRRVEQQRRADVPLACDRSGIVWVAGHRIADRVKRTGATVRTLGLRWEPAGGCD